MQARALSSLELNGAAAPFAIAIAALALGLISPALSLLCVALAASYALTRPPIAWRGIEWRSLAGPALAALLVGFAWRWDGAMGVLLVWRIVADARWSAREANRLFAESGAPPDRRFNAVHYYAMPAFGLACAAYTAPHVLAGLPLDLPHVPAMVPLAIGALALFAFFDWTVRRLAEWRLGAMAKAPAAHALTHHALFLAAYVLSPDLSAGFMAMLVWRLTAPYASRTAVP